MSLPQTPQLWGRLSKLRPDPRPFSALCFKSTRRQLAKEDAFFPAISFDQYARSKAVAERVVFSSKVPVRVALRCVGGAAQSRPALYVCGGL